MYAWLTLIFLFRLQAKSSTTKFNDISLTCTWHNPPSVAVGSTPNKDGHTTSCDGEESTNQNATEDYYENDTNMNECLYDDVDTFGRDVFDPSPEDNEGGVDYDYDEDEDLVDYD